MVSRPGIVYVSLSLNLFLSLAISLIAPEDSTLDLQPIDFYLGTLSLSSSDLLSHLLSLSFQFSLRVFVYIHALCLTPILHHRVSITSTNSAATLHSYSLAIYHFLGPRF